MPKRIHPRDKIWLPFGIAREKLQLIGIAENQVCGWTCGGGDSLILYQREVRDGNMAGIKEVASLYYCENCKRYTALVFVTHAGDPMAERYNRKGIREPEQVG